ncbi:MAG: glycosyltransferase family 1 protein [Alphaproteobacteria bacterium]|nr:MAG: glycosyltransferase family 1 protein [Alphaproteobacteria bacterium]
MHVILTVNAAWNVWNFRLPVVRALLAEGHRVTVLAPPDETVPKLEAMGCAFRPLAMRPQGLNPAEAPALCLRLARAFRRERPDIVLGYTIKNNVFGAMAAKATGTPFLPNVTGLGTAFLAGGLLQRVAEALYRRAFRGLPVVFFQNEDDSTLFTARGLVHPGQVRLLPGSGIDLRRFAPAPMPEDPEAPVFLMIARLLRDKGVHEYVDAAREVRARHPAARFRLLGAVGADNRTAVDRATVDRWVAEGAIEYLGTAPDVRPHIAAAHCVVLPSYREGAPRTLIEAAAMARPLIATDVPGCRAVVRDGETGFLCAPRSARALAAAIERFLALDAPRRAAMGAAGRAFMEEAFDEALVVEAYARAIAELVPAGGRG